MLTLASIIKGSSSPDSGRRLWVARFQRCHITIRYCFENAFWQQQQDNKDSESFLTQRQLIVKTHKQIVTYLFLCIPTLLCHRSRSGSISQAFTGPPSPLGSRGEEEEDEEGGNRGLLFLPVSFFFQLTNWQLIDGYLLSPTKSSISITKAMYSRVGQTVNYMLPPLPSLSSL